MLYNYEIVYMYGVTRIVPIHSWSMSTWDVPAFYYYNLLL